uniref:LRRCT domain-containing protein n=1 Tax=Varanus komodoensis TaxID=61221 RepID=A0A8D2J8N4_VARKO
MSASSLNSTPFLPVHLWALRGCTLLALSVLVVHASKACPYSCFCYESASFVDCHGRYLVHIPHGVPHSTWMLRHLYLQSNRLTVIHNGFFFMLQNLEVLLLQSNNISSIEVEAFTSLHNMNLLALTDNQIIHLKFKTFLNIQTISTHIQLAGNPWACDCDLQRVFGKIVSVRHLHVDDYENITCSSPWQLAGSPLTSVDSQLCVAETATVLVITVTVLVTVIKVDSWRERPGEGALSKEPRKAGTSTLGKGQAFVERGARGQTCRD